MQPVLVSLYSAKRKDLPTFTGANVLGAMLASAYSSERVEVTTQLK